MLKYILTILFSLLLPMIVSAQGVTSCTSYGVISTTTQICTGTTCKLCSVEVITDGTNDATCTVYDGTTTGGTKVFSGGPVVGAARFGGVVYSMPRRLTKGIYTVVAGTGATCIVHYDK